MLRSGIDTYSDLRTSRHCHADAARRCVMTVLSVRSAVPLSSYQRAAMSSTVAAADSGGSGDRKHLGGGSRWELVPLPPVTYSVKSPAPPPSSHGGVCDASNTAAAASPAGALSSLTSTSTCTRTQRATPPRKRKRPVRLALPATIGREFLVRSTLSACDRCNVVGRKRIKQQRGIGSNPTAESDATATTGAAAAETPCITSSLCQRCQHIFNSGKYLSKQMARFDVMTAEGDQNNDTCMGDTLRLSVSGLNAVAIQINKQPIVTNQQGNAEAMVQLGDVVSFILNPRGIRDEKDCAAHNEEFWSMRFTVAFNGERDSVDKSRDDAKNPAPALSHKECDESERKPPHADTGDRKVLVPNLSAHDDDDYEEEDETPVLSMHHFSATQWQNQSAMDITSVIADTPYEEEEDGDDDDDGDDDADDSPTIGERGLVGDRERGGGGNGRDLSSFSLEELKKLRDGLEPTKDEISASFYRALFSMTIRHQEKSRSKAKHQNADGASFSDKEEDDDEEGQEDDDAVPLCDQDVSLPKLLEYTTIILDSKTT